MRGTELRYMHLYVAQLCRLKIVRGLPRSKFIFQREGDENSHCNSLRRCCMRDGFFPRASVQVSVLLIPAYRATERGFNRSRLIGKLARRFVALNEHSMTGHLYALNGNLWLASSQAREP